MDSMNEKSLFDGENLQDCEYKSHFSQKQRGFNILKGSRLLTLCEKFIEENNICCPETIHQTDWVIENAYELIEGICEIVGYKEE